MKHLVLVLSAFIYIGCSETTNTYNLPFVEDNYTSLYLDGQYDMCTEKPESIFCVNSESIGDIKPTVEYAHSVVKELSGNTKYKISDEWKHTETVHEYMVRDCEDEAMTMISHMINDGIDKKYLYLVYQLTSKTTAHVFVGIKTNNGLMHMDINTGVAPIEERINWHMKMTDVGVHKWIKGNIR